MLRLRSTSVAIAGARLALTLAVLCPTAFPFAQAAPPDPALIDEANRDVLRCGDFQMLDDDGHPVGWQFPSNGAATVVDGEDGDRFVRLRPIGQPDARKIMAPLPLRAGWRRLKFSARVRGKGLKAGMGDAQTAHVGVVFFNRAGEVAGFSEGVVLEADSDWVTRTATVTIPRDAILAVVDAGNFGTAGDFFVDDILVRPDEARAAAPDMSRRAPST